MDDCSVEITLSPVTVTVMIIVYLDYGVMIN